MSIDFDIDLYNGQSLFDPKYAELLALFRSWLSLQDYLDVSTGKSIGSDTLRHRLARVMHLIDYFLLHGERLNLVEHGLQLVTESDIRDLLNRIASSSSVAISIYDWPRRLASYIDQGLSRANAEVFDRIVAEHPEIEQVILTEDEFSLGRSRQEIVKMRLWLFSNGLFERPRQHAFKYAPNFRALAKILYQNTFRGQVTRLFSPELCFQPADRYVREFEPVPARTAVDAGTIQSRLVEYVGSLRQLIRMREVGLPAPGASALSIFDDEGLTSTISTKSPGRYRSVPRSVIFPAIRNAIEFAESYGGEIVAAFGRLSVVSAAAGMSCSEYAAGNDIGSILGPELCAIGVQGWSLLTQAEQSRWQSDSSIGGGNYYERLRKGPGLLEVIRVLYGASELVVGAISARRFGEMADLECETCVDEAATWLHFFNRKSGVLGLRQLESRPIPLVVGRMLRRLEQVQYSLRDTGLLDELTQVFCPPSSDGAALLKMSWDTYNDSIEIFCDYFEVGKDAKGRRYYIRQHQCRRFLVMLFFWGGSNGDMNTLRWYLGHTDARHLWNYLSESIPGKVLREGAASFAGWCVREGVEINEGLNSLLRERYGDVSFDVLDSDELDEYIEALQSDGKISIEPEFFESPEGKAYRILVRITGNDI